MTKNSPWSVSYQLIQTFRWKCVMKSNFPHFSLKTCCGYWGIVWMRRFLWAHRTHCIQLNVYGCHFNRTYRPTWPKTYVAGTQKNCPNETSLSEKAEILTNMHLNTVFFSDVPTSRYLVHAGSSLRYSIHSWTRQWMGSLQDDSQQTVWGGYWAP